MHHHHLLTPWNWVFVAVYLVMVIAVFALMVRMARLDESKPVTLEPARRRQVASEAARSSGVGGDEVCSRANSNHNGLAADLTGR